LPHSGNVLTIFNQKKGIAVSEIATQAELKIGRIFNEAWLENQVLHPRAQRPGLALAGYFQFLNPQRIQIFGKTEIGYLAHQKPEERKKSLRDFLAQKVPGIIVSESQEITAEFIESATLRHTPILVSGLRTSLLNTRISSYLYQYFSKKIKIHGTLLDIMGQGVMITGASGIGKSETALALVSKGYPLIADDVVEIYLNANDDPVGRCNENVRNLMEARGLGIINVVEIFGAAAVLKEKKLDVVINLEKWDPKKKYDRLGEENLYFKVLDIDVPMFNLPVAPGRDVSTLIEVAVRYFLSRKNGARSFNELFYGREINDQRDSQG
jgi:HPr kinase/phosphorylase